MKNVILFLLVWTLSINARSESCESINRPIIGSVDVQVIFVKDSQWDTNTSRSYIESQIRQAERILGLEFNVEYAWKDDEKLISYFSCAPGPLISLFNQYGSLERPTLIFSGKKISLLEEILSSMGNEAKRCAATTVAIPWYGSAVKNEGIAFVYGPQHIDGRIIAHEFGHLLGGLTGRHNHAFAVSELMAPFGFGCSISEPWFSAIHKSRYIEKSKVLGTDR